jgi:hypothetical protein
VRSSSSLLKILRALVYHMSIVGTWSLAGRPCCPSSLLSISCCPAVVAFVGPAILARSSPLLHPAGLVLPAVCLPVSRRFRCQFRASPCILFHCRFRCHRRRRRTANSDKSADPILHRESLLLQNRSDATGDFKNQRGVGVPKCGPNLSCKVIISKSFS